MNLPPPDINLTDITPDFIINQSGELVAIVIEPEYIQWLDTEIDLQVQL